VQLPATILTAYFDAIGNMFATRKKPLENQKAYLDSLNGLAIAEQKRRDCANAVETGDMTKIKQACGN